MSSFEMKRMFGRTGAWAKSVDALATTDRTVRRDRRRVPRRFIGQDSRD
jgi:hypothetical protein